jgi:hypothetical protein
VKKRDRPIRVAYADPPYPGQAKVHYRQHADYAGEVDHQALIGQLSSEFPDGWALSTSSRDLRDLLPLCPSDVRVAAWVKPFAVWKRNVYPAYAWEPLLFRGGRNVFGDWDMTVDWLSAVPEQQAYQVGRKLHGAKPDLFCAWLFRMLGLRAGDEFVDLFPGSGRVGHAWRRWQAQKALGVA